MFRVIIETDNAAFEHRRQELARILRDVAKRVETGSLDGKCRDINGNTVGHFETTEGEYK